MGAKQKRKTPSKSTESDEKITDSYSPVFVGNHYLIKQFKYPLSENITKEGLIQVRTQHFSYALDEWNSVYTK